MKSWLFSGLLLAGGVLPLPSSAATSEPGKPAEPEKSAAPAPKVHYKQADDINFEKLLIEGQLQKPTVTVVTGTVEKGGDGLLRLRRHFLDRVARDFGEDAE